MEYSGWAPKSIFGGSVFYAERVLYESINCNCALKMRQWMSFNDPLSFQVGINDLVALLRGSAAANSRSDFPNLGH